MVIVEFLLPFIEWNISRHVEFYTIIKSAFLVVKCTRCDKLRLTTGFDLITKKWCVTCQDNGWSDFENSTIASLLSHLELLMLCIRSCCCNFVYRVRLNLIIISPDKPVWVVIDQLKIFTEQYQKYCSIRIWYTSHSENSFMYLEKLEKSYEVY